MIARFEDYENANLTSGYCRLHVPTGQYELTGAVTVTRLVIPVGVGASASPR